MATDYQQEYAQKSSPAYLSAEASNVQKLLGQWGAWIDTYRGGIPAEWAATIMEWESGGNFAAPGDPTLGEVGFYQVPAWFPPTIGMPAESRYDPETNVMLGLMGYQLEAARWAVQFPDLVILASPDTWKLARLSFAVGWGGATGLAASAAANAQPGDLYGAIVDYANQTGGVAMGSQSASQVWWRVVSIQIQWQIAQQASLTGTLVAGPPTMVPNPPGGTYTLPSPYAELFVRPWSPFLVAAAILGVIALWRYSS